MDEGTCWARVQRIFNMMDIRRASVSDAQVDESLQLLIDHESKDVVSIERLEVACKVKDAVVHPDTGEKIFFPLRLSFIIPCNVVLDTLMIFGRGLRQNVAAQWLNQTYNFLHYHANRNISNQEGGHKIFEAYVGATTCAVLVLLGCMLSSTKFLLTIAGQVFDENGDEVGQSRLAGAHAVSACTAGRIFAAALILVIPPLVMHRLERTAFYTRHPALRIPTLMAMVGASIQIGVPLSFGIFKQQTSVSVVKLKDSFHNRVNRFGQPVTQVFFNKGV